MQDLYTWGMSPLVLPASLDHPTPHHGHGKIRGWEWEVLCTSWKRLNGLPGPFPSSTASLDLPLLTTARKISMDETEKHYVSRAWAAYTVGIVNLCKHYKLYKFLLSAINQVSGMLREPSLSCKTLPWSSIAQPLWFSQGSPLTWQ